MSGDGITPEEDALLTSTAQDLAIGIDSFIGNIRDTLREGFDGIGSLPLVGDKIEEGVKPFFDSLDKLRSDFREGVTRFFQTSTVGTALDQFATMVFDVVGPSGINILRDGPDAGLEINVGDVRISGGADRVGGVAGGAFIPGTEWVQFDMQLGQTFLYDLEFDLGVQIDGESVAEAFPSLGFNIDANDGVRLQFDWDLHAGFGVSLRRDDDGSANAQPGGFYIVSTTRDAADDEMPELLAAFNVFAAPPKDAFGREIVGAQGKGIEAEIALGIVAGKISDGTVADVQITAIDPLPLSGAISANFQLDVTRTDPATSVVTTLTVPVSASGSDWATFFFELNANINEAVSAAFGDMDILPIADRSDWASDSIKSASRREWDRRTSRSRRRLDRSR